MPPSRAAVPATEPVRNSVELASELREQGYRAASAGRPADAVELLRRALGALPAPPGAATLRIRILITLSYAEAETGSVDDGLAHLTTADGLVAGLPEGPERLGLGAIVQDQRALILHRAGRTSDAIALYDESVRRLEEGRAAGAVDATALSTALINRGLTNIAFGLPEAAERDVRRTIELAEAEDEPLLKAKALNNLGDVAQLSGDLPAALGHYERAGRALSALAPDLVPRLRIDQARTLLAAGLAAEAAKHLDEALVVLRRRRVGQDLAEAELGRAAAALLQGDHAVARDLAARARRRFGRRGSKPWAELAALMRMRAEFAAGQDAGRGADQGAGRGAGQDAALASGGGAGQAAGRASGRDAGQAAAQAVGRVALDQPVADHSTDTPAPGPRPAATIPAQATTPEQTVIPPRPHPTLAHHHTSPTPFPSSLATPAKAAGLAKRLRSVGLTDEAAVATLLAVRMAVRRGDVTTARELLARVPVPGPITPIDHRMLLRLCRAELAVATGSPAAALREAEEGLAELGLARDRVGGLDLLCGTAVHGRELGELAIGLVLDRGGDAGTAFDWLERTRAQVYRYEPLPAIDDPVLARRVAESRTLSRAVQQARLDGRPADELEARLEPLQREVARLGWHTSVWGRPRPVCRVTDVHARLGDRAMVSFVAHGNVLSAVVLAEGDATLVRLGDATEVFEQARQLHADLDALAPDRLPKPLADAITASAARRAEVLDGALIAPLSPLVGGRDLVVVPTGDLYAVPWNALPSLHGRPVVVAPSATAWLNAASAPGSSASRVVLVGGPNLPEAVGEVSNLRATYPDAVTAEEVAEVLTHLDGARLAHIAAHGEHESDNALFSRLELADGPLFAHETARLRTAPEQVILAACSLALSHIRPGDEALGFAGALLASGSRTVVAAVNKVGDQAAALTMETFHKLLSSGRPTPHALAEATAVDPLRRPFVCFGA
ncbi:CHAT domain-containing protein [Saccharothrix syringae]|nr:CHAT domain-containing tetratricopeptide repeat protein [Saccharothrix syringae]